jgi:hypothetical protein
VKSKQDIQDLNQLVETLNSAPTGGGTPTLPYPLTFNPNLEAQYRKKINTINLCIVWNYTDGW